MRVTQRTLQDNWIQNIQGRLTQLDQLNRQIGTGARVGRPSDDPSSAGQIVRLEEIITRNEQFLKNVEDAVAVQQSTESALDQVYQLLVRAKSLAVEGANDASDPTSGSLLSMASEVEGIAEGILQLALSRHQGEYLFAGTAAGTPPFNDAVGGQYRGDSTSLRLNMGGGQTVEVNLPGDLAFREPEARSEAALPAALDLSAAPLRFSLTAGRGKEPVLITLDEDYSGNPQRLAQHINEQIASHEQATGEDVNAEARIHADGTLSLAIADLSRGGELTLEDNPGAAGALEANLGIAAGTKNVFGLLRDLRAALETGDARQVGRLLDRVERSLANLASERGKVGSRHRNLEFARERLLNYNVTSQTLRDKLEGVDLPEAVVRLSAEEQAYQTALAAGARIFNVSIIDFLR